MLSMKTKYALKALIFMADRGQQKISSKQIGTAESIPQKFLDNILQELRQNGFVESKRGILGGYVLAKPPEEIFLGDVIRVLDGPLAPIRCASLSAYQKCDDCPDEAACYLREVMLDVRAAVSQVLDGRCLADIVRSTDFQSNILSAL